MNHAQHVGNISGGKDSDCIAIMLSDRQQNTGRAARFIFADTGHEHAWTYDHLETLSRKLDIEIEWVKEDFGPALERRRARLPEQWRSVGVPEAMIERALELLWPTGVPYLDMVMSKGMFAAGVSRKFCTELLKLKPSDDQVVKPLLAEGRSVVQWLGIRADESAKRANADLHPRLERSGSGPWLVKFRPMLTWTVDCVLAFHAYHGLPMNPLYAEGFERVGCFPCINEGKGGIAIIVRRFPDAIEKLRAWEALCTEVNVAWRKSDHAGDICTFFASGKVPGMARNTIDDVATWSLTKRGGRQFDLFAGRLVDEQHFGCTGGMGFCEQ